jgi:hypothetical protein
MTQIISNKSAAELINLSESEDRVVMAFASSIDADLHDDCDGDVEFDGEINARAAHIHEYCGETWRVHTGRYLEPVNSRCESPELDDLDRRDLRDLIGAR